jgi:hypothetical protein
MFLCSSNETWAVATITDLKSWSVRFAQGKRVRLWGNGHSGFENKDLHNPISAVGYASTYSQNAGLGQGQKGYGPSSLVLGQQGVCSGRESNRLHQPGYSQCRLTLHSRGGPTACHQAWATGCGGPFSVAQAWRPTVGLPLSSNV